MSNVIKPVFRNFQVVPNPPENLSALYEIARNFRWCWDKDAIDLFQRIDRRLWSELDQNPVHLLGTVTQQRLEELSRDDSYLAFMKRVHENYLHYLQERKTWFQVQYGAAQRCQIAYFSAEFGIVENLPIYSGGLGVLAGDHLKSASDVGLPLTGVGLAYHVGYFRQYLNPDGWQQERYPENDFYNMALKICRVNDDDNGPPVLIEVEFPDGVCRAMIWKAMVGRIPLILLDTNINENPPNMRSVTNKLYVGDREARIRQEILLGIGGIRALKALGIEALVCHMNEGHSAFLALERTHSLMQEQGLNFHEAKTAVTAGNVFTTHTPVPAGNEIFDADLVWKYIGPLAQKMGLSRDEFLGMGRQLPGDHQEPFCMTVLAMRFALLSNGVSELHGEVSRKMWERIWPNLPENETPITAITNGVHIRTWISKEMCDLYDRYLGPRWIQNPVDQEIWERVEEIPDAELWRTHERRRERLVAFARRRLVQQLRGQGASHFAIQSAEEVLDPEALTIGFARRFAAYKRATLMLHNLDRLKAILSSTDRPVQFLFAGKAHPADSQGKELIRRIIHVCREEPFRHRMVFIEDYDMNVARYLVQGVDIWMNTPRRPLEASGTSGMKATANGALHFSVLDGWWCEGYNGENGFAIGRGESYEDLNYQDAVESNAVYEQLEKEIIPMFYDRGRDGLPRRWIRYMKNSLKSLCPAFSANRMVRDYTERFYIVAAERYQQMTADGCAHAREFHKWHEALMQHWPRIRVLGVDAAINGSQPVGSKVKVSAELDIAGLHPRDLAVEVYYGLQDAGGNLIRPQTAPLDVATQADGTNCVFEGVMTCHATGLYGYAIRAYPQHPSLPGRFLPGKILWG